MKHLWIILLFAVPGAVLVHAQPPAILPLDSILHHIELRNPNLLAFEEQANAYMAKAEGSDAWMPPSVSVGLMRFPYNFMMAFQPDDPMNQAGIGVSVEQMFPVVALQKSRSAYLKSFASTAESRKTSVLHYLRRKAKGLYNLRVTSEKKLLRLEEAKLVLDLLIEMAEARFTHNQNGLQAVFKAKARRSEITNMELMLQGNIRECNLGLNSLMVRDLDTEFAVDTSVTFQNYQLRGPAIDLLAIRSDVQTMDRTIQTMELEKDVMKAELRPELGLRAEHMTMFGMPSQWTIMAMARIPFAPWSAKMANQELESIDFEIEGMRLEKEAMLLMAENMVLEWESMLATAYRQYETYRTEIVPMYQASLSANLASFKQNDSDLFELLDAWEMALMKELEVLDHLYKIIELEAEYAFSLEIE